MIGCVYLLSFPNGKNYVGVRKDLDVERRVSAHLKSKHSVGKALRKYGRETINVSILARSRSWKRLMLLERQYIRELGSKHPSGYNLTEGGEGSLGRKVSSRHRVVARNNMQQGLRRLWKDPKFRDRHSRRAREILARLKNDPQFRSAQRKAMSSRMKRLWKDPAYRARMRKFLKRKRGIR